jgi:hypothetical protein
VEVKKEPENFDKRLANGIEAGKYKGSIKADIISTWRAHTLMMVNLHIISILFSFARKKEKKTYKRGREI